MRQFKMRVSGDLACFTRPEFKAERVSYEVMTPSAARGALEAVFWHPGLMWTIEKIVIERPIQWTSFLRNEVKSIGSKRPIYVEADRTQRNTVALRDVSYVIVAHIEGKIPVKYEYEFERRLQKGQVFHQAYLGCREFAARIEPCDTEKPIPLTKPLGMMFFDFDYGKKVTPRFFSARVEEGVVHVPHRRNTKAIVEGVQS
jgi:CRISPR-associated protein Cas5d